MKETYDYDVIIIGAGIGGLVCGCYLAKAGLKTLIVEKNAKPGGYCTSFARKGFHFDTFVHSLGSCRENGNVSKILQDLKINERINLKRCNPSDVIMTPDYRISFYSDYQRTIHELRDAFPEEAKGIEKFFVDILDSEVSLLVSFRRKTFMEFLNNYFKNDRLKAILSFPVMGNNGVPSFLISAFSGCKLYREFMLDGGYYPEGGMGRFSNTLAECFKEFNGDLLYSCRVKKIKIDKNQAVGVILQDNRYISAGCVISNADAKETFHSLVGASFLEESFNKQLSEMVPSLSMFIVYLGVKEKTKSLPEEGVNFWYLPHYNIENMYKNACNRKPDNVNEYMLHVFPQNSMAIFINAQFEEKEYWDRYQSQIAAQIIKKVECQIPGLSKDIAYCNSITPYGLYKITNNYKGAAYGWAATPAQFAQAGFTRTTNISNLFLSGHWTTLAQGIGGVVYIGKTTAESIIKKVRIKKPL